MVRVKEFTDEEWQLIFAEMERNSDAYGLPRRVYGSAVIGSFNIRKLGSVRSRSRNTWDFLGRVCRRFDLLAVQEVMDNIDGLHRLKDEVGSEWHLIASDKTGTYPGDRGVGERLAFLYRWNVVERGDVASDVTYDRSKVTKILFERIDELVEAKAEYERELKEYEAGTRKRKPKLDIPFFLSFIRQPFCVGFKIKGFPDTDPYSFMAINAHLIFGSTEDRWREFEALMGWIRDRVEENDKAYYPNFVLLGDLNLDYDNPEKDSAKMEEHLKSIDQRTGEDVHVNFPFLDVHPGRTEHFTSNVKLTQRYDQIGLFFRQDGLPTYLDNSSMGREERGPDYGVFNFSELFARALTGKGFMELSEDDRDDLVKRYHHEVSDHMPIWVRLKLPDLEPGKKRKRSESDGECTKK